MAIHYLSPPASFPPDGVWSIDWDDVAQTIGATVSGTRPTVLQVVVKGSMGTYIGDCLAAPASGVPTVNADGENVYALGDILNKGRAVILGPGSVIGKTAPVTSVAKSVLFSTGLRWEP